MSDFRGFGSNKNPPKFIQSREDIDRLAILRNEADDENRTINISQYEADILSQTEGIVFDDNGYSRVVTVAGQYLLYCLDRDVLTTKTP